MSWRITKEPCYIPSLLIVLYTCAAYERDSFPSRLWSSSVLSEVSYFDTRVQHRILEDGNEIVYELSRRDFYQEIVILDTCMGRTKCTHTQSQELHIGILVVQLSLQCRAHSVFVR